MQLPTSLSLRSPLLAAASLALAACAGPGGYRVNADVRSMQSGGHDASALTSAAGAKVDLVCPEGQSRELGRTDASGSLHVEGEGTIPLSCKLVVGQAGARAVQYPVADLCTEQNTSGCRELALRAVISTNASGSAGDAR